MNYNKKAIRSQVAKGLASYIGGTLGQASDSPQLSPEKKNAIQEAFDTAELMNSHVPFYQRAFLGNSIKIKLDPNDSNKIDFRDQSLTVVGYLSTMAAKCASGYACSRFVFGDTIDSKYPELGVDTSLEETFFANALGTLASFAISELAKSSKDILNDSIQGKADMPPDTDLFETKNDHYTLKNGSAAAIINKIKETPEYKEAKLDKIRRINLGLSIVNASLLGYHGYKRYENRQDSKYVASAAYALAGIMSVTNLGFAFAQGFAQPLRYKKSKSF